MYRLLLALLLVFCVIEPSWARWKLNTKEFTSVYEKNDLRLPLRGVGVKTLFMMRVFVAGLYMDPQVSSKEVLNDVPKHLEVKFYTSFKAKDFTKYTIDKMKTNLSKKEFDAVKNRFERMGQYFPNIKSGDVFSLTYQPGRGTVFTLNQIQRGVIEGEDFAKAIYSTWFGPKPIDNILKKQVLSL